MKTYTVLPAVCSFKVHTNLPSVLAQPILCMSFVDNTDNVLAYITTIHTHCSFKGHNNLTDSYMLAQPILCLLIVDNAQCTMHNTQCTHTSWLYRHRVRITTTLLTHAIFTQFKLNILLLFTQFLPYFCYKWEQITLRITSRHQNNKG